MTRGEDPGWQGAKVVGSAIEVAEHKLDMTQRGEVQRREDLVADLLGAGEAPFGRGPRLLDEAEVRLEHCLVHPHHSCVLTLLRLLGELDRCSRVLERALPAAGVPLEVDQHQSDQRPGVLVASRLRIPPDRLDPIRERGRARLA